MTGRPIDRTPCAHGSDKKKEDLEHFGEMIGKVLVEKINQKSANFVWETSGGKMLRKTIFQWKILGKKVWMKCHI